MSAPTARPSADANRAPTQDGQAGPLPSAADPAIDTTTVGGPALPGWDSELEDAALEEARHIGTLR